MDPHFGLAHHPAVNVGVLAIHGIVIGDVLQVTGGCVQAKSSLRCHVTESHPTSAFE